MYIFLVTSCVNSRVNTTQPLNKKISFLHIICVGLNFCTNRLVSTTSFNVEPDSLLSAQKLPQTQFPGQLLDAFVAYLYLLSPPEGAFHKPVPASNIVFAGDSAGGNLSFSLLLCLLTLNNMGIETVRFHGKDVV